MGKIRIRDKHPGSATLHPSYINSSQQSGVRVSLLVPDFLFFFSVDRIRWDPLMGIRVYYYLKRIRICLLMKDREIKVIFVLNTILTAYHMGRKEKKRQCKKKNLVQVLSWLLTFFFKCWRFLHNSVFCWMTGSMTRIRWIFIATVPIPHISDSEDINVYRMEEF